MLLGKSPVHFNSNISLDKAVSIKCNQNCTRMWQNKQWTTVTNEQNNSNRFRLLALVNIIYLGTIDPQQKSIIV